VKQSSIAYRWVVALQQSRQAQQEIPSSAGICRHAAGRKAGAGTQNPEQRDPGSRQAAGRHPRQKYGI